MVITAAHAQRRPDHVVGTRTAPAGVELYYAARPRHLTAGIRSSASDSRRVLDARLLVERPESPVSRSVTDPAGYRRQPERVPQLHRAAEISNTMERGDGAITMSTSIRPLARARHLASILPMNQSMSASPR
jgi:hypothetical protein